MNMHNRCASKELVKKNITCIWCNVASNQNPRVGSTLTTLAHRVFQMMTVLGKKEYLCVWYLIGQVMVMP